MRNHVELTSRIREEATSIAVPVLVLVVGLAGLLLFEGMSAIDQRIWLVVLVCATVSSIAGFAFSALASASLVHLASNPIYMVQIMLIASTAIQIYGVWALRKDIRIRPLLPFFAGGVLTVVPGVILLINANVIVYIGVLGAILVAYSVLMLARPGFRFLSDSPPMRALVGGLGGLTGAVAAFPGAAITMWCSAQGWDKRQQRAIYQPFILGMQLMTLGVLAMLQPQQALQPDALKFALPAAIGGFCGLCVFERLSTRLFNRVVAAFLLVSGLALLARAF
jgi:uncharacterized membrane protein YfcA